MYFKRVKLLKKYLNFRAKNLIENLWILVLWGQKIQTSHEFHLNLWTKTFFCLELITFLELTKTMVRMVNGC